MKDNVLQAQFTRHVLKADATITLFQADNLFELVKESAFLIKELPMGDPNRTKTYYT